MITVSSAVPVLDVIQVNSEQMLVTAVPNKAPWTLTVTRAYNGTTAAAHTATTTVNQVAVSTLVKVTDAGGALAVKKGDTIQVDNEQMSVTNITGGGPWLLTVTRSVSGTTLATHSTGTTVYDVVAATILQVTNTGAASQVAVGDVIQVDSEQMLVTNVTKGAVTVYNLTVTRAFNGTTLASHSVNTPVLKASLDTVIQVTNAGGKSSVTAGNTIQIDTEQMLVDSVISVAPQVWNLVVERAQNGTTKVGHNQGKPVVQVVDDSVIRVIDANGATGQEINAGMVIQIESEQMLVDSVVPRGQTPASSI